MVDVGTLEISPVHDMWEMVDPQCCKQKLGLGLYQSSSGQSGSYQDPLGYIGESSC